MKKKLIIFNYCILALFILFFQSTKADDLFEKGRLIFLGDGNCATCHTLEDANSYGNIGPNLNEIKKYLMGHMYYFAYRTNDFCKVTSMLLASYSPLQKYKRMHFEQFKYKEDCESYYQGLIRNESDELCIEYLKVVSSNNCKNCKPKGFFKMLSEI